MVKLCCCKMIAKIYELIKSLGLLTSSCVGILL